MERVLTGRGCGFGALGFLRLTHILYASRRSGRLQVWGEETPDFSSGFEGDGGIDAVEHMAARRIGIDLILEVLAGGLQRGDQLLDFAGGDIVVIGVGMDQERSAKLFRIPCW